MNRFAYAFYATNDAYAAAAIIAATALRRTGAGRDIAFLFLHHGVSPAMVARARRANFITRDVEPLQFTRGKYYRDCLTKLRIFQLVEYERVVLIDADSLPLQNLDHLFTSPFTQAIAAPRTYHRSLTVVMVGRRLSTAASCLAGQSAKFYQGGLNDFADSREHVHVQNSSFGRLAECL